jgi:transposase-like protein
MEQNLSQAVAMSPRLSEQAMFTLIEEQQDTGDNVRSFCARHNISQSRFYYWLRKYRKLGPASAAEPGFTLLKLQAETPNPVFCELIAASGERIRFFQPVSASFLRSII